MPIAEAVAHLRELDMETGSHYAASKLGFRFAASIADTAVIMHAEMFANANRDRKKQKDPIRFPTPFPEPESEAPATEEEVERARAVLDKHSMFAE